MPQKSVQLGKRPHYPIVITKLHKKVGDTVKKQDKIFEFKYSWKRALEENEWRQETTYNDFESPAEGVIKEWRIKEGDSISADMEAMTIDEACGHEVQMHGMCSLCGADMTEANWAAEELDADRAKINMTHDQTGLMVSDQVAERAEYETQKSLIRSQKLSLVVDLDQTIIHACVDPTVEKWMSDPSSPNHAVVQDIKSFWLDDAGGGQTYYIKLRPGLEEFLATVAEQYEMHVYTMGTRAYARNIAKFIDPDKRYFGNRIISRNENGSHSTKQLQRLFPVSTDMVVIIDDRADVWPMNERNLIKVTPFDFFKGQGDLNSPFAPQPQDLLPTPPQTPPEKTPAAAANGIPPEATKTSPIETLAKMGGGNDEALLSSQKAEHDKAVEKQVTEQPLLHMQEELEKDEKEVTQDHRPQLLIDDDEELIALQDHLNDIHAAFYETYNRKKKELRGSDEPRHLPGQTKPRRKSQEEIIDLSLVPDVGDIMTDLKSSVLEGLVLCLSGLIPMGVSVERSELGRLAESFGAQVVDSVSRRVTHLVVATSRPRTKKVQQAAKIPSIDIVNQNWLTDCMSQWRRLETEPYFLDILPADREGGEDSTAGNTEDEEAESAVVDLKDFNWAAADEELEDLSDTDGDSEADDGMDVDANADDPGTGSETDTSSPEKKGRKRKVLASADESDTESVLAKKQRIARSRGASSLRSVRTPNGEEEVAGEDKRVNSSLPTPGPTGDEEDAGAGNVVNPDGGEDFDEDELEKALMAEFDMS